MKRLFIILLLFSLFLFSCTDGSKYRVVQMENDKYVIQENYPPTFLHIWETHYGYDDDTFNYMYKTKEAACSKMSKLIEKDREYKRSKTVKQIIKCN